jgi:hypothetical protein
VFERLSESYLARRSATPQRARSIPLRQFSIPDCQCAIAATPSVIGVTLDGDDAVARAPVRAEIRYLRAHGAAYLHIN